MGLKIDFFPKYSTQDVSTWQIDTLEDAASEELMINFHGCSVPTGESTTWPNEMTREGIRGMEYGVTTGEHVISQVFNRLLVGFGDFFSIKRNYLI